MQKKIMVPKCVWCGNIYLPASNDESDLSPGTCHGGGKCSVGEKEEARLKAAEK